MNRPDLPLPSLRPRCTRPRPTRTRSTAVRALVALAVLALAGCSSGTGTDGSSTAEASGATSGPASAAASPEAGAGDGASTGASADASSLATASASSSAASPSGATASASSASASSSGTSATADGAQAQLFGGGRQMFPGRRLVALYGTPGTAALDALGEQGPQPSVERVKALAAQYQPYSQEKVVPSFEIIATGASSVPGPDGNYSEEYPVERLRPYLEAARKNGIYVILDFQPGTADFQAQVKQYASLLEDPNVGVGLDPEWKLQPGQVPLQQIGSVAAEEVNRALATVADITRTHGLPQKAVVLHQFTGSMYADRQNISTAHPELALTIHADGHGTPAEKMDTWTALQQGLPRGIRMAWKNFYDEDTPTFTPQQTYQLSPKPWIVTYQ